MISLISFCKNKDWDDASTHDFYNFIKHDFYDKEGKLIFEGSLLEEVHIWIVSLDEEMLEYLYNEYQNTTSDTDQPTKTFDTKYGLFILYGCKLTLAGTGKFITIESPETLDEDRLEKIYKVIWDETVEKDSIDELGKIAYGLEAILPQSF